MLESKAITKILYTHKDTPNKINGDSPDFCLKAKLPRSSEHRKTFEIKITVLRGDNNQGQSNILLL
jgi:hypothetical protein